MYSNVQGSGGRGRRNIAAGILFQLRGANACTDRSRQRCAVYFHEIYNVSYPKTVANNKCNRALNVNIFNLWAFKSPPVPPMQACKHQPCYTRQPPTLTATAASALSLACCPKGAAASSARRDEPVPFEAFCKLPSWSPLGLISCVAAVSSPPGATEVAPPGVPGIRNLIM